MTYQRLHPWRVSAREAIQIQNSLKEKIVLEKPRRPFRRIAACDVSFDKDNFKAAVVVFSFPGLEILETSRSGGRISFPYIPGLLSFREAPALLAAFRKIRKVPDVVIFDGQGIAHPRRMGIATHMGLLLQTPSIGCAKTPLYGKFEKFSLKKGNYSFLKDSRTGELLGVSLCTRDGTKPVFVSCGYKIDLESAIGVILTSSPRFRIPQPLRVAHILANEENR
jgi:deoxyribonuclease V